jgi:pyruvate dehydrogenase E1 component
MFGFQRTGDGFWAAADQMARGFALGATAGRTTLNGEGLQHEDGHSVLLASTNPAVVHYDPAFGFEIGHIVRDGLRRMYGENSEQVFYYLTVYNEPYVQPPEPEDLDVEGVLKGMYLYKPMETAPGDDVPHAQILASGVGVNWALEAQQRLAEEWEIAADVWSVTSWNELRREAMTADEWNLMHPDEEQRVPYVTQRLSQVPGPVVAVSDFMRAVQDQIAPYIPAGQNGWMSLGTDGFGLSDTRAALRRHFKVDAQSIVIGVLTLLARRGEIPWDVVRKAHSEYRLDDINATTAVEAGGET